MATLRIDHTVNDFDAWKQLFDSDPADRRGSGVRHYRVSRSSGDPVVVTIDLEFDDVASAQRMHEALAKVWAGPAAGAIISPRAVVVEEVESASL